MKLKSKSSDKPFNTFSSPIIAEKINTVKSIKILREFLEYLCDPDFPYFAKLLLFTALSHMNAKLDTVELKTNKILNQKGSLKITTKEFRTQYQENIETFTNIGLTVQLLKSEQEDERSANLSGEVRFIRFSFSPDKKEKYLTCKSYKYLRVDYVPWFKGLVTKHGIKKSNSVNSFFVLTTLLSSWDLNELNSLEIKKLAVTIGLKNQIKKRYSTKIKTTINRYLKIMEEEGLILLSEVVKPTHVQFKLLNINAEKKRQKTQQKEKAKQSVKVKASEQSNIEPKQTTKQTKVSKLSPVQEQTKAHKESISIGQCSKKIIGIKKFINPVPLKHVSTPNRTLPIKKPKVIGLEQS